MPTRLILRREKVDESNLGKIVKETGYQTLADEHSVLIARAPDREKFKKSRKMSEFLLTKYEKEDGVKLNEAYLVFIAELPVILRRDLHSPFLTRTGLRLKGIEPIARYAVGRENKEVRLVREY
ncbi:MAG TPA: hypothetical protein VMC80_01085 [Patescibacteria group bacterium]|nr:hypothetical protein [Patescibacteria group bacterium]